MWTLNSDQNVAKRMFLDVKQIIKNGSSPFQANVGFKANLPLKTKCLKKTHGEDSFWKYLQECDKRNFLMVCSITPKGGKQEYKRDDGLVEGHAYSLLACTVVKAKGKDLHLMQLRNPWGQGLEWKGRF